MDYLDAHELFMEADRLRVKDHEAAEKAFQKRFSDALKALDPGNGGEKQ